MPLWEFRSEKRKVVTFVWVQGTKGRGVFSWNGVLGDSVLGVYYTMRLGPGVRRVLSVSVLAVLASRSRFLFFFFFCSAGGVGRETMDVLLLCACRL